MAHAEGVSDLAPWNGNSDREPVGDNGVRLSIDLREPGEENIVGRRQELQRQYREPGSALVYVFATGGRDRGRPDNRVR